MIAIEQKPATIGDDELRIRCEALAKEYGAPLPDGDLGLMEAERRLAEYHARLYALEFSPEAEKEIVLPIVAPLDDFLHWALVGTEPWGFRGAAVQLRYLANEREGLTEEELIPTLKGVLRLVEAKARKEAEEETRLLDRDPPLEPRYVFTRCRFEPRLINALVADGYVHPDQLLSPDLNSEGGIGSDK